mmetsp:Transcript_68218/g.202990  ORF Transcript_68218/g.202990 Transcript_68218/m.202990 type:complete len:202 (+) Transcript_68218:82-687(+)
MVRPAAPEGPPRLLLNQGSLAFQDRERLLQAGQFCFTASLALLVGLRLRHALLVQCLEGLEHCVELLLHPGAVGAGLRDELVEVRRSLALILDILVLGRLLDGVLLGLGVVRGSCALLRGSGFGQRLREVRLTDLYQADDAGASALSLRVIAARLAVVLAQDLESELHARETLLQVRLVLRVVRVLLAPDLVHLRLGCSKL